MSYVIIGGGVAGVTAAEMIRARDPEGVITIVSEEFSPLYSRVLLPHYLKGKVPRERVFLKNEAWYQDQRIEWLAGSVVHKIHREHRAVELLDGRELPYDTLIIATGAGVRLPEASMEGVHVLRTLGDADTILAHLERTESGSPAVVYGGGFMAAEFLHLFVQHQRPTTLLLRSDRFWSSMLSERSGALLMDHVRSCGVQVETQVKEFILEGTNALEAVVTPQKRYPAEILGVGIGPDPDLSLFEEAGLVCGAGGVTTDAFLRTNDSSIYAIGDIAHFFDETVGRHRVVGNWLNALTQARAVGKTVTGEPTALRLVSSYATNILGKEVVFVGDTDPAYTTRKTETTDTGAEERFVRDGRLVGVILLGDTKKRMEYTKEIQQNGL